MRQVIHELERLGRRSRTMLLAQRAAALFAGTVAVSLVLILLDYGLRLPSGLRMAVLLTGLATVGWLVWRYIRTAFRFRPSLTELALRVERNMPPVAGRLATSVEFAVAGLDERNSFAARSVRETANRLAGESMSRVLRPARTLRDAGALAVVVAVAAVLAALDPAAAATGISRLFLPYSQTEWPARTGVETLMHEVLAHDGVHPRGQALPLRAGVVRGPEDQHVDVYYRLRINGAYEPLERMVLTHQGAGIHERLVTTNAEAIEFYFQTDDARTARERVELVRPPAVTAATLTVTPPPYASGRVAVYEAALGPGVDERSITDTASLVGSDVELVLDLNKALPVPGQERSPWLRRGLGWDDGPLPGFEAGQPMSDRWILRWRLEETRTLRLELADEHGLTNVEAITYRIDAVEDRPPSITIAEPQTDEAVLPTALVALRAEAQDDVAVAAVGLEAAKPQRPPAPPGDVDGTAAPTGDADAPAAPTAPEVLWEAGRDADALTADLEAELDLAPLELQEGDVLVVTATARDMYEVEGARHEVVRSLPRRLRVMSELEFASQLRRQLGAVRQNAIRIESIQAELQDDLIEQSIMPGMNRAQGQITERIAAQREAIDAVAEQLERNRLDDVALAELVQQGRDFLDLAGRSASEAAQAMERRGPAPADRDDAPMSEGGTPPREEPAAADRDIVEAQQAVRDELASLIELLDRDEDTWVVTRQLEGLLDEQVRLQGDTQALGERTIGLSPEDLAEADRAMLEEIAERETDLAEKARQLMEELRKRAESLDEADPQSAAGMRTAANTGERRELDRDMSTAAERAEQNQMRAAVAAQQSAAQTLQQMLEDIEENKRARAEDLLRKLASLMESIERLITVQENELEALAAARDIGEFGGRDRAMIRLNQNTLAVAGEARSAGAQTRRIARTLDRAADAQGAAVAALRGQPIGVDAAEEAERRSLEMLEQAKKLTEQLQEQTEEQETRRRREELLEAYRGFAEQQLALRTEVLTLAEAPELDRRGLMEARRLGTGQDELRGGINELRDITSEIMQSPVFSHAHRLIDVWSRSVSEALWESRVDEPVTDRQQLIIDGLQSLVAALEEAMAPPEEFEQDQAQGQGGGTSGPQPLIPPVAELKLLRGLQEQVYNQTRDLDRHVEIEPGQRRARLRDVGEQQRELHELGREILDRLKRAPSAGSPSGG